MDFKELKNRPDLDQDSKLAKKYAQLKALLNELKTRSIPDEIVNTINSNIEQLNAISGAGKEFKNQLQKKQAKILKLLETELKLVTKNHYRNTWLALGMAAFGIPLGVAFGAALGDMSFLAIGLPIGMAVGIAVGTAMDKKASDEGKQLDLEVKC